MTLSGVARRGLTVGLVALLVGGCAAPSPYSPDEPPSNPRRTAPYSSQAVQVTELTGWWVLLTEADQKPICLVVRPAVGTALPSIRAGYEVSGEGGFYMYLPRHLQVPFFGFYGTKPFGESRAELNGQRFRYTNDRDTVLGWEGQRVSFQVWSDPNLNARELPVLGGPPLGFLGQTLPDRPKQQLGDDAELTSGEVDFSGVGRAFEAMLDCHSG